MKILREHEVFQIKEPLKVDVQLYMIEHNVTKKEAVEALMTLAHGGLPPQGYSSWKEYWKA